MAEEVAKYERRGVWCFTPQGKFCMEFKTRATACRKLGMSLSKLVMFINTGMLDPKNRLFYDWEITSEDLHAKKECEENG